MAVVYLYESRMRVYDAHICLYVSLFLTGSYVSVFVQCLHMWLYDVLMFSYDCHKCVYDVHLFV